MPGYSQGPRLEISFGKPQIPWQSLRKCHGAVRATYILPSLQEKESKILQ